ncbi:hypothetical protein BgiMline_013221 [Biomphalaria glabrata]
MLLTSPHDPYDVTYSTEKISDFIPSTRRELNIEECLEAIKVTSSVLIGVEVIWLEATSCSLMLLIKSY